MKGDALGEKQTGGEGGRPCVSVVVPFRGDEEAALRTACALRGLDLGSADELIVADNTEDAIAAPALADLAKVVRAPGEVSSYHARNAGAAVATCEWLLFIDADCVPAPDLLDAYLSEPVAPDCGVLAGKIRGVPGQDSLLARYAQSRSFYDGDHGLDGDNRAAAPTGNLMVRRAAFDEVAGFVEGIRSAGDVDLCWRIQRTGWTLARRPEAIVAHRHREDLPSFLDMLARYGAGASWLNRRYPGSSPRWPLSTYELARSGFDALRQAVRGNRDEAAFRLVDALGLIAHNVGYSGRNEVPER